MLRSAVLVGPLALAGVWVHRTLEPNFYHGTVVVVLKEPRPGSERGQVFVRLSAGPTVQADYDGTWPVSMVQGRFGGKIRLEPVPAGGLMAHWNQCSTALLKGLGTCGSAGVLWALRHVLLQPRRFAACTVTRKAAGSRHRRGVSISTFRWPLELADLNRQSLSPSRSGTNRQER